MKTPSRSSGARFRAVILKRDRLYGELIQNQVRKVWADALVEVFQRGFAALESIQASEPDLLITGVRLDDMDGLEHLEPFVATALPILIVTSHVDCRTVTMLQDLRYDGIYDGPTEGLENLPMALREAVKHRSYVSPSIAARLRQPKNLTVDALTPAEQRVLSVIGGGADDNEASGRLGISWRTVNTHRKVIMRKLGLHQKGQLMRYAVQHGYVLMTPQGIYHPGFQRELQANGRRDREPSTVGDGHSDGLMANAGQGSGGAGKKGGR